MGHSRRTQVELGEGGQNTRLLDGQGKKPPLDAMSYLAVGSGGCQADIRCPYRDVTADIGTTRSTPDHALIAASFHHRPGQARAA